MGSERVRVSECGRANASERERVTPSAPACWLCCFGVLKTNADVGRFLHPLVRLGWTAVWCPRGCGKCSLLFAGWLPTLLFGAGGFHGRRLNA